MKTSKTSSRKRQHIDITLKKDVSFRSKTAGFEKWEFIHNALPEINRSEINTSSSFLGKKISIPLIISSMTGGYSDAEKINRLLAEVCAQKKIGLGVGSQRQALESNKHHRSFSIVREIAPDIPIFGNIGAVEAAKLKDVSPVLRLIDLIEADGFAIHLNPLQELLQREGEPKFRGVLSAIEMFAKSISIPIIVKEIGSGISAEVAKKLIDVGVQIIDVAGAGGTSWAGVEIIRRGEKNKKKNNFSEFWDWGIPTVEALRDVCALKNKSTELKVISSGGITNGVEMAKSIAFGADYVATARLILIALINGGLKTALELVNEWENELKNAMFLTGSSSISVLQTKKMVRKDWL